MDPTPILHWTLFGSYLDALKIKDVWIEPDLAGGTDSIGRVASGLRADNVDDSPGSGIRKTRPGN